MDIMWNGKSPKMSFLFLWSAGILFVFAIPLVLGWFSLAVNREKMKPEIWMTIYGCAILLYVVVAINLGFISMTKDLPSALQGEFAQISGSVQIVKNTDSTQTVKVNGIQFEIPKNAFKAVNANAEYIFIYLPNSRYVIDIIN